MNNSAILGEEAAARQIVENDFSATSGHFEDDSVIALRSSAFRSKTNLQSVNLPEITMLNGTDTFAGCSALRSINLPKLTEIKGGNSFSSCEALTDINIPLLNRLSNSLVTYTFYNCKLLKKLDIRVIEIFRLTFNGCSSLVTLILRNNAVTSLAYDAFNGTKYAANGAGGAYVYVPRNLISSYQTATNWSTLYAAHSDMFRPLEDYTVDGTTTGEFIWSQTPKTPMSVRNNEVGYTRANATTYVTTTADGKVVLTQNNTGAGMNQSWMISPSSLGSAIFTVPVGSTLTVFYTNIINPDSNTNINKNFCLVDVSGNTYCIGRLARQTGNTVKATYTNNTDSPIGIGGVQYNSSYIATANGSFEVNITVFVDGERYI